MEKTVETDRRQKLIDTYGAQFFTIYGLALDNFILDEGHFDLISFCHAINGSVLDCTDSIFYKFGRDGTLLLNAIINSTDLASNKNLDVFTDRNILVNS